MEKKLRQLFDYQKFGQNHTLQMIIDTVHSFYDSKELSMEDMTILGHTPTGYRFGEAGKMFRTETWIDIDTGAAGGGSPMLLRLDDLQAFYA